jgi:hypothetical protein
VYNGRCALAKLMGSALVKIFEFFRAQRWSYNRRNPLCHKHHINKKTLHSDTIHQTGLQSATAATGASVVAVTGARSATRASAASEASAVEASVVIWKSFARSQTREYHGSQYRCCCFFSFLFSTGKSIEFVAAVTSALRSGTIRPLGQAVTFCSAVHRF